MSEVDMSVYTPESLIARAIEALEADVPKANEVELRRYLDKEIPTWKLNRDAGHAGPIPEPPLAYELKVDAPNFTVAIVRGNTPVCDKYVDPATPEVPLIVAVGAAIPGMPGCFARGYNAAMVPDNTPDGYVAYPFGKGGPAFRKVIKPGFFAGMFTAYYQLVQ